MAFRIPEFQLPERGRAEVWSARRRAVAAVVVTNDSRERPGAVFVLPEMSEAGNSAASGHRPSASAAFGVQNI